MSSPLGENQLIGASGNQGGYEIEKSCRFNDNDSPYLSRTPSSAGNRRTWTWSGWAKRGNLSDYVSLFGAYTNSSTRDVIRFNLHRVDLQLAGLSTNVTTTAVYRDPAAWYHIVVAVDTILAPLASQSRLQYLRALTSIAVAALGRFVKSKYASPMPH